MATDGRRYDMAGEYEVRASDVEYQTGEAGRWEARIYEPIGAGPFPVLLDVHGGAWSAGSRLGGELINEGLAASGLVIVAVDFRLAPDHPYPSQIEDVNYATRWLKAHAGDFNADTRTVGGIGSSSGGHTVLLSAMRPLDPRYAVLPMADETVDASLDYIVAAWPVLDPYARYQYAKESGRDRLVTATEGYFLNEDAMKEGNPQGILERGERAEMPPLLIIQGTADENIPMSIPERFVEAYRGAGGSVELEIFPGLPHAFGRTPSPGTDRAIDLIKAFVARQLATSKAAV